MRPLPAAQPGAGSRGQAALCGQPPSLASAAGCSQQGRAERRGWGVRCCSPLGPGVSGRKGASLPWQVLPVLLRPMWLCVAGVVKAHAIKCIHA